LEINDDARCSPEWIASRSLEMVWWREEEREEKLSLGPKKEEEDEDNASWRSCCSEDTWDYMD
jgi:hypothetical protein